MTAFDLEIPREGPVVKEIGSRGSVAGGRSLLLSALSVAADELPFDEKELYGFLHFRIDTATKAQKRSRWFGGRIYNALTGQSGTYIPLSGTHLRQTLLCVGIEAPEKVVVQGRYALRLDYALRAHERLKKGV